MTTVLTSNANLGNMMYGGGVGAAYVGDARKPSFLSALLNPSLPGTNWIAKNWSAVPGLMPTILPAVMAGQVVALRYSVAKFTATAPTDQSFLGLGSPTVATFLGWDGSSWHTLWNGFSAGAAGEAITVATAGLTDTNFYYAHAFGFSGDGTTPAAIASLQIYAGAEGLLSPIVAAPIAPPVSGHVAVGVGSYGYVGTPVTLRPVRGVQVGAGSYSYVGA